MDVAISVLTYQQPLVSGPDGWVVKRRLEGESTSKNICEMNAY
jgi:hypothetical protein